MSSATSTDDQGFHVPHFFVLVSLVAATVAVVMARPAAPSHLILISLTIGASGVAAVAFYRMLAPLVAPPRPDEREPMSARLRADLEREKALTLRSIKELEFDRAMGKLSDQDFEVMAGRLRARAMGIMTQLDSDAGLYRRQIERDLAERLTSKTARHAPERTVVAAADPAPCVCGTANDADARFCKRCGAKLAEAGA